MPSLASLSIRRKLMLVIMGASTLALGLVVTSLLTYQSIAHRQSLVRQLSTLGTILAANVLPALEFDDPESAEKILSAASTAEGMNAVAVFDPSGALFAAYRRQDQPLPEPLDSPSADHVHHVFSKETLTLSVPLGRPSQPLGQVVLQVRLHPLLAPQRLYALVALFSLGSALVLTFLLSSPLLRLISEPLLRLAALARDIGTRKDYSLRARKSAADEIGLLIDSFNGMLDEIASRDEALSQHHEALECRVEERTQELQRQVEETARAQREADAASRAKSDFLTTMSHEIRTPLNGVIGCSQLLQDTELSPNQRELAETIQASGRALLSLINDILDLSKIEAGKLDYERLPVDLPNAVNAAVALVKPQADARHLPIQIHGPANLPGLVIGDPRRIGQVLLNLLGNALKFTEKGHLSITLRPEPAIHPTHLACEVTDTGIGIPADRQALLFEKFYQIDASTTRRHRGTGLGLAISRHLVEGMQGRMGVDSEPGRGSTFWFTLPLHPNARQEPAPLPASSLSPAPLLNLPADPVPTPPPPPSQPSAPKADSQTIGDPALRVLVAEDNLVNQRVAVRMLERLGCQVDLAADGMQAVERARAQAYHVVFMDCLMPEMDGFHATAKIRELERDGQLPGTGRLPIVALTANALKDDRQRCLDAGMDDYLSKPINLKELARILEHWRKPAVTCAR